MRLLGGDFDNRQTRHLMLRGKTGPPNTNGGSRMTTQEMLFLAVVVVTLTTFAVVLAGVSWLERDWARKNGK